MDRGAKRERRELLALTAEIVPAHVGADGGDAVKLGDFIGSVFATLSELPGGRTPSRRSSRRPCRSKAPSTATCTGRG